MTRVVVLGISGLDADLLRVYGPTLPDLRRLLLQSPFLEMRSCFPPEPAPAWASIYTGLHPANHGILERAEYLESGTLAPPVQIRVPQAKTFWGQASRAGKRVCVVNPLFAYPAEAVNGIMLAQPYASVKDEPACVVPETAAPLLDFPPLINPFSIPSPRQLEAFCTSLQTRTLQQAAAALELFNREPWDLFFVQLDALDHAQHFLWRYSDPGDPTYPGRNHYANRILEFYRLFDEIIGRFRRYLPDDSVLLVVSGHGHGRRCAYRLHLNEWLRAQGLLVAQERLHDVLPRIARHLSGRRARHSSESHIDQQASVARVVDLAGISPSGGISLNRDVLARNGESYERMRGSILQKLTQLRVKGYPVVNWARAREELHGGVFIARYPDIIFELRSDFGVASSLNVPLVTQDTAHRVISGGHTLQGVLLMEHVPGLMDIRDGIKEPTVMDVAPTVLQLLGLESARHDGKTLVSPTRVRQLM
ncbi:MAG TPA: alkaline phosphatase family protein [Ktedonobacteraceae bacterium]|nr:alkaline phosphatase family protein [Ktedonobacteraceae bacterium]